MGDRPAVCDSELYEPLGTVYSPQSGPLPTLPTLLPKYAYIVHTPASQHPVVDSFL